MRRFYNNSAQAVSEYALMLGVVVGAILLTQGMVKKAVQKRIREGGEMYRGVGRNVRMELRAGKWSASSADTLKGSELFMTTEEQNTKTFKKIRGRENFAIDYSTNEDGVRKKTQVRNYD